MFGKVASFSLVREPDPSQMGQVHGMQKMCLAILHLMVLSGPRLCLLARYKYLTKWVRYVYHPSSSSAHRRPPPPGRRSSGPRE
jgi:hypothetical protein